MRKLKEFIKNCKYTKKTAYFFLKVYQYFRSKYYLLKKKRNIQREGIKIIEKVQKVLKDNNVFFFFDMGTLLGIVREGRIIKHDLDIDVGVRVSSETEKEHIKEIFSSIGAKEHYRFIVEELGVVEQSFVYDEVKFDINYYYQKDEKDYCYLMYRNPDKTYMIDEMSVVELSCEHIEKLQIKEFCGIKVNVPENAEKYLSCRYGENWKIPDKNYIYWKGPSTRPTDYIGKGFKA